MFYSRIPSRICDEYTHTQAIVVWTGGRERLQTGFKLLCEGKGDSLFISGVHSQETLTSLLNLAEVSQVIACQKKESLKAHTYIGHFATNTRENALETKNWARLHNIKSLRFVTAAFHMPRSLLEIKEALPGVTVIPHPVFPKPSEKPGWEEKSRAGRLIFLEYVKYLRTVVRINANRIFNRQFP